MNHLSGSLMREVAAGSRVVGVGPSVLTLLIVLLGVKRGYRRSLSASGAKTF